MKNKLIQKYSLVASLGAAGIIFLSAYSSKNLGADFTNHTLFVIIAAFVLYLLQLRKEVEQLTFREAFKNTFVLGFIVVIVSSLAFYYVIKFYNRTILEMYKNGAVEMINNVGFSKDVVDAQVQSIKSFGPMYFTISFFLEFIIKNLFWSFIVSTFLKKEKADYADEQY